MAFDRKLVIPIIGDTRSFDKAIRKAITGSDHLHSRMGRMAKGFAIAGAAAVGAGTTMAVVFGVKSVRAAMSLVESVRRVNAVFGKSAPLVRRWGVNAASSMGLSEDKALEAVGSIGLLLRNMDFAPKKAAGMSKTMVQLAADMGVFNKASPEDTLKALQRGLGGMMRGLKQYGIVLSAADVKVEALRETHKKDAKDLTTAELTQARYNLILKKSQLVQGAFHRQSKRLSGVFHVIGAQLHNLTEQFGIGLLPVVRKVANVLQNKLADPKFRTFVRHLGHEVGVTLYNAFVALSAWFKAHWPAIKQGFRDVAKIIKGIIGDVKTVVGWAKWVEAHKGPSGKDLWHKVGGAVAGAPGALLHPHIGGGEGDKGKGDVHVHGDINVHGVDDPKKLADQLHRHAKKHAHQTRGKNPGAWGNH